MSTTNVSAQKSQNFLLPIIVMFFLFAMISFVTGFQNPFGVILKEQLSLSSLQSQLGNFANFLAYAFMGIPAGIILQKKGYKFSAVAAVLVGLCGVVLMFVSSTFQEKDTIFLVYLIGAFVAGFAMCMLNTVVNPMLNTLGGGGKKGNQLLQFGGSCNSLAATICPVLVGYLIGDNLRGVTLVEARPALYIAAGIFVLAFVVLAISKLPEPILDEIKKNGTQEQPKMKGLLKFRHFVLGVVAIFLYVGIEVGIPNMANLYMTTASKEKAEGTIAEYKKQQADPAYLALIQKEDADNKTTENYINKEITKDQAQKAEAIKNGEAPVGQGMSAGLAGTIIGIYWFLMLLGRLGGGALGGVLSSRKMLCIVSATALVLLLCAICLPSTYVTVPFVSDPMPLNVVFLILCGLCTSVMWGGIFNLAVEGLGKYTAVASGLFMVMVCGGGILPLLQGAIADSVGYIQSYWVIFVGVAYLLYYAVIGSKVTKRVD